MGLYSGKTEVQAALCVRMPAVLWVLRLSAAVWRGGADRTFLTSTVSAHAPKSSFVHTGCRRRERSLQSPEVPGQKDITNSKASGRANLSLMTPCLVLGAWAGVPAWQFRRTWLSAGLLLPSRGLSRDLRALLSVSCTGDLQGLEQPGWEELHHPEHDGEHRLCEC